MNIPNPIEAGKDIVGSMWRHDVAVVRAATDVASTAGSAALGPLDKAPKGLIEFVTMPLQAMQLAMQIGWWVLQHMRELMLAALAIVLAVFLYAVFSLGRTAWGEVHSRVRTTVRTPARSRSGGSRAANSGHKPGTVFADGVGYTACARGGRAEAKQLFRRAGVKAPSNSLVFKGRCPAHPSCSLIEAGA